MKMIPKIGYAVGDCGISVSYFSVSFFFMYYLTDIVKMSPALAGLAIFIGKLWDGINDPIVGIINDRIDSKMGRKRSFIMKGAIPFGLCFYLLWLVPTQAAPEIQFSFAVASALLYATAYSIVVVPYMAMVPLLSNDYHERTQITGIRAILSTVGTIAGGGAAMFISSYTNEANGLRYIMLYFMGFTILSVFIAAFSIKNYETRAQANKDKIMKVSLTRYVFLLKDKNVFILMIFKLFGAVATGCLTASFPYFTQHILGNKDISSKALGLYILFTALSIPIWNRLTHHFTKQKLLLSANLISAMLLLLIGFFTTDASIIIFYMGCAVLGCVMASYILIPYSLVPDLVEYYQHTYKERHESVYFGLWMSFHQLGLACSGLILGIVLHVVAYDGQVEVMSNLSKTGIRLLFGLFPGLFLVIAALILQKYQITKDVFEHIKNKVQ